LAPSNKKSAIHVLHVDDDPLLREITKLMLLDLDSNFKIDNASSVDESLKKLSTGHYDVVVSDYEMPQKDGLQFLKELREQNNDIPFILFTGKGREEVVVKALNMGADGYINKQGNPETVYGELEHIILTSFEKRNTQKLLWESEERFKKLVTNSKDAIMLTQADGIIRYLSPASKNVLGYEPSELIGKVPWIIHPDDLQRVQTVFQLALSSKVSKTLEYRILTKQGETKWVSHAFSQILENGKPTQIVSNLTDITERKKAEEAIIQSETHYRLLADNIRDVIWEMDLEGHFTYVSPSAIHLSGYTPDEAIKQSIVEVLTPESARIVLEDLQRFRETGTFPSKYYELEEYCKDGSTVWIGVNFSVLRKRDGEPKSFLGVSRNITERKKDEENLRLSEERFRRQFEEAWDPIFVADAQTGIVVDCNRAACELVGRERTDIVGVHQRVLHPSEDGEGQFSGTLQRHISQKEGKVITKSGEIKNVQINANSFTLGNKTLIRASFRDITEYKKTQQSLLESEEKFRNLAEESPNMIFINLKGRVVYVNKKCEETLGYSKENFYSADFNFLSLISPDYVEALKSNFAGHMRGEEVSPYEYVLITREGERINAIITTKLMKYENERALLGIITDITERKKSEEILAFSERKYREFANSLPEIVFESDDKGMLTFVNRKALEIMGYSSDEVKHLNIFQCLASSDRQRAKENVQNRMRGVITVGNEYLVLKKDGDTFPGMIFTEKIVTEEGKVGLRGVIVNITQTKKTEEALRDSEEKHRKLYEESLDAIFLADAETGILIDCNRAALELVGREKSEIVGQHQRILHPAHEIEGDSARAFKQHQKQDGVNEVQVITKTGEIKDVSIKASHVVVGGRKVLQGVFRDVTESKKVQNALIVSEEKYRETIQNANVGIVAYQPDGKITILNPTMQKMTGYTIEEIPSLSQWFEKLYPNEVERQKTKDKWFKKLTEAGEVKEGQAAIITKQGEERIFLFDGFRLFSGDFIAFARDITDRKIAEEALNVVMVQLVSVNEKLGVVGSLTRHDVRNKLSAVTGYAYLLKKKYADQADIVECLGKMEQAVKDSMKIFEFAKMYEQLGIEELKHIDVEKTVNEAFTLFSGFALKVVNDCYGLRVLADSFLRQLFYNFMDNTIKYGKKAATVRVYYETSVSGDLNLIYEDDGVGISTENKSKLFSEGFSTGGSTGFGLFLIKKMMGIYGWTITETGEVDKGVRFVIAIPKHNMQGKENYQIT
jgi:PAS domain S-box-containing protein